jgi:hypothetical protein
LALRRFVADWAVDGKQGRGTGLPAITIKIIMVSALVAEDGSGHRRHCLLGTGLYGFLHAVTPRHVPK